MTRLLVTWAVTTTAGAGSSYPSRSPSHGLLSFAVPPAAYVTEPRPTPNWRQSWPRFAARLPSLGTGTPAEAGATERALRPVRRRRKPMSEAQKKAVGIRMKKYWAARRQAKGEGLNPLPALFPTRRENVCHQGGFRRAPNFPMGVLPLR